MKLLFTTENFFFFHDTLRGKGPEVIEEAGPHHNFWGITWDRKGNLFLVRTTDPETHFIEVRDFYSPKDVIGRIDLPTMRYCHQILFVNKVDRLFVTNTHDAEILVFKPNGELEKRTNFNGILTPGKSHTNSLYYNKGFLYVGNHNRGKSFVVKYNVLQDTVDRVYHVGEHMHNIWFDENSCMNVCSSKNAEVVSLNLGIEKKLFRTRGFPRGVVQTFQEMVVGESVIVPTEDHPMPEHVKNPIEHARICVRRDFPPFEVKEEIDLTEFGAKQVFDIRAIGIPDYAHKD